MEDSGVFANGYRRIYYYHLKKCAGTTLNAWLERQVAERRSFHADWLKTYHAPERFYGRDDAEQARIESACETIQYGVDAIYSHVPMRRFILPGTFCFTVVRRPRDRILSQIADWRREARTGASRERDPLADVQHAALELPLADFFNRFAHDELRHTFDNYLTRALAAVDADRTCWETADVESLLPAALKNLRESYHFVGLTERLHETRAAIADALGLAPDTGEVERLNESGSARMADEANSVEADLSRMTRCDEVVYAEAMKLFEQRTSGAHTTYDAARFEERHAAAAVQRVQGTICDDGIRFDVRDPLIATGVYGRDGAGTSNCAVWTGPGNRGTIYMAAPAGESINVKLWIRGFADASQLETLRVEIDDRPARFALIRDGSEVEVLQMTATPTRPFVKLTLIFERTLTGAESSRVSDDPRKRGSCFDGYGWSIRNADPRPAR